jgi:hypothetical protein
VFLRAAGDGGTSGPLPFHTRARLSRAPTPMCMGCVCDGVGREGVWCHATMWGALVYGVRVGAASGRGVMVYRCDGVWCDGVCGDGV